MTVDSAIDDYFQALSRIDRDAYLACFSQDATVLDPYGAPALHASEGLNKFMDNMERTWESFEMTPGASYAAGDRVAVNWEAKATARSGKTAEFAGINVFTLNEDGLISRLEGYWDFKAMVAQIS
jgi:steroid delta-isomerase-like uncharacterized protein